MKRYYQPVPKGNRENAASKNPEPQNKLARAEVGFQVGPPKGSNNREMEHSKIFDSKRRSASPAASSNCSESGNPYEVCLRISLVCARYLLRQGIPFYHIDPSYTWDKGHFLEMVDWYQGFDKNVKRAFDMLGPDRCHEMASIQFQKDMVKACAEEVAQAIREEIGDSRFSVLIDDTTDISNKEQMGIILRFVNKQGKVVERFLGLEWVNDTTPTAIKGYLVGLLARHGLSISRIRGQGYNGDSNMRGDFNDVQRQIRDENSHAFYVHCFAFQLESLLVSISSSSSGPISFFFNNVSMIVAATSKPCMTDDAEKRRRAVLDWLESCELFSRHRLQEVPGDTKWGSHHTTLGLIDTMWDLVLEVLMIVDESGCRDSRASLSITEMETFEFVFILKMMLKLFAMTNELSLVLQRKDQDIIQAVGLVVDVNERLKTLRDNGWEALLEDVKNFCVAKDIEVPNMDEHRTMFGRSRLDGITVTELHHYRVQIFFAAIDSIRTEMAHRFNDAALDLLVSFSCLDPRRNFSQFDVDKLARLADIYSEDFLRDDCAIIKDQLEAYNCHVKRHVEFSTCHDIASLAAKMVETKLHLTFPLVYRLIELALLLPMATASIERMSSAVNLIPTEMCDEIPIDWLSDFALCHIEDEIFKGIKAERIMERLQSMATQIMQ
ncbi:hypothetical protein EJB05_24105 [Eragrostis curvula]|uniref:DUF4371 domain-containing protein n=1 Tax=Eragrostis curvula TaxID=38414 RepID=A0A5J9V8S7_9POAL|nr:hypothetical protein EJB05_24105 [Eragrostis curvula]